MKFTPLPVLPAFIQILCSPLLRYIHERQERELTVEFDIHSTCRQGLEGLRKCPFQYGTSPDRVEQKGEVTLFRMRLKVVAVRLE